MRSLKKTFLLTGLLFTIFLLPFCSKNDAISNSSGGNPSTTPSETVVQPNLPAIPFNYNNPYPAHIQNALAANDNTPADNPITNDGATLGRVLFYDKHLSKNNSTSCGSCHQPNLSFSDNATLSKGFNNGLTSRHSMPLLNLRFYKSGKMFWDERAPSLEKQVLQPIQNSVEMGLTLAELESKVKALSYYPALFQKAFGTTQIDSVRIAKAVSQFLRSLVTYQSKYDLVKQGLTSFTADEAAGEQFFISLPPGAGAPSCAGCHTPPMFLTSSPAAPFGFPDPNDHGINNENRFKSGSLRNIALTAPYFHNGAVGSLASMLQSGPPGTPGSIPAHGIPAPEVNRVLAFLQTLTDQSVTTNVRFSDPFK